MTTTTTVILKNASAILARVQKMETRQDDHYYMKEPGFIISSFPFSIILSPIVHIALARTIVGGFVKAKGKKILE